MPIRFIQPPACRRKRRTRRFQRDLRGVVPLMVLVATLVGMTSVIEAVEWAGRSEDVGQSTQGRPSGDVGAPSRADSTPATDALRTASAHPDRCAVGRDAAPTIAPREI